MGAEIHAASLMAEDTNPRSANDFAGWVTSTRKQYVGRDLRENQPTYVPHSELKHYWTIGKISAVLRSYDKPLPFDAYSIQSDYLRIFSTLVFTSNTRLLLGLILTKNLDDTQWPLVDYPNKWPNHDRESLAAFEAVKRVQWVFFPYHFKTSRLQDSELDPDCILPIEQLETIVQNGGSAIHKIKIHDNYNTLSPTPKGQFLVLKDYDHIDSRYVTEVEALRMLRMGVSESLITFYGSFKKDGHGFLILEFADGGNLYDYFANTPPPTNTRDTILFWASLLKSLEGLDRIHQLMRVDSNLKDIIQGIHQDIKPANILLFQGSSDSPYEFLPKIADFGLFSHARKTRSNSDEAAGHNKEGNQRYKVSANVRNKIKGVNIITPGADIFSFGAVLSATAAWIVGGQPLQQQYFRKRRDAHAKSKRFSKTSFEGCFHAGMQEFPVVKEMHEEIRTHCRDHGYDQLTPRILDIVEKHMLLPKLSEREQANVLIEHFLDILSSESLSPTVTLSLQRRSTLLNNITDDDVSTPRSSESIQRINNHFKGEVIDSVVKNLVDQITRNLRDRDQFFFIDDSTSMQQHRRVVLEGFQALSSIAKHLDPNRVELAFASNPRKVHRARNTKSLVKKLRKHNYQHDPTMMENSLSELVHHQIIRKLPVKKMGFNINPISRQRVSVYIFTDGNWGVDPVGACRVERPVEDLICEVQRRHLSGQQVTLHFVRFGDSKDGGRHLEFLDHFGERFECDIVDVKHISSDVVSLFYGPLTYQNDRQGEADL